MEEKTKVEREDKITGRGGREGSVEGRKEERRKDPQELSPRFNLFRTQGLFLESRIEPQQQNKQSPLVCPKVLWSSPVALLPNFVTCAASSPLASAVLRASPR